MHLMVLVQDCIEYNLSTPYDLSESSLSLVTTAGIN